MHVASCCQRWWLNACGLGNSIVRLSSDLFGERHVTDLLRIMKLSVDYVVNVLLIHI